MRLIDADALKVDHLTIIPTTGTTSNMYVSLYQILNAPTVDAVEVVRCKDCKHFVDEGFYCAQNIVPMFNHFYCYYGEREEGE